MTERKKGRAKKKEPISRDRIKRLIHGKGMSYQKLCDELTTNPDEPFLYETFQYCMNHKEMTPDMIDAIAKYFDVSKDYIKGENMFYFDENKNLRDDIPFDHEESTYIGTYMDSFTDAEIEEQKKREQELKDDRIRRRFIDWIKADADAVSFSDEGLIIGIDDYIAEENKFSEYGISYGPKRLRDAAIKAIKAQLKADYETLRLMENYANRKKERKTK